MSSGRGKPPYQPQQPFYSGQAPYPTQTPPNVHPQYGGAPQYPYPPQQPYPAQQHGYPGHQPQVAQPPYPPGSQYPPPGDQPPPYNVAAGQPVGQPGAPVYHMPVQQASFDATARFDPTKPVHIPPPPPGVAPNSAQMAAAQGQPPPHVSQNRSSFWTGGGDTHFTLW
ncbi:calcium-binding protein P-like [Corticium candelabrum]|uniref:calcium-binding protein P-like n=1 Tax=Corticium candelabrum TaxID=121492 RepID=UPI002E275386|nr:calcium-binding protein P-like [Corticium candelabrum]